MNLFIIWINNNMKCLICEKSLEGRQKKFCSSKCKSMLANNKLQNYQAQQTRGKIRKKKLIEMKGGCCEKCGYNKSLAALSFHHLNPNLKKFQLDIRNLSNRKWEMIIEEFNECELLCFNCHMELHHGCEW